VIRWIVASVAVGVAVAAGDVFALAVMAVSPALVRLAAVLVPVRVKHHAPLVAAAVVFAIPAAGALSPVVLVLVPAVVPVKFAQPRAAVRVSAILRMFQAPV